MRKWEYYTRTYTLGTNDSPLIHHKGSHLAIEEFIDLMGNEGWELVTAATESGSRTRLFFKRPKEI